MQTKFRRTLLNHLSGVDGRTPFTSDIGVVSQKAALALFSAQFSSAEEVLEQGVSRKAATSSCSSHCSTGAIDNLEHIFKLLSTKDTAYVQNLARNVVQNYATPAFGLEDWRIINQMLRFMVWDKTARCILAVGKCELEARAKQLCEYFSTDQPVMAMVFEQAAQVYGERTLQQSELSHVEFGQLVGTPKATIMHGSELFRVVMAIGAAFHKSGNCMANKPFAKHRALRRFDLFYYVDPQSLLLAIFGPTIRTYISYHKSCVTKHNHTTLNHTL